MVSHRRSAGLRAAVALGVGLWLWTPAAVPASAASSVPEVAPGRVEGGAGGVVRPVLRGERFPWYDAGSGELRPILPWPDLGGHWWDRVGAWVVRNFGRLGRGPSGSFGWLGRWVRWLLRPLFGGVGRAAELLPVGLALLLLTAVLVLLLELLRRYRPTQPGTDAAPPLRVGGAGRVEGLPAGLDFDLDDPWAEARRRRSAGDLAGAVVYLFAHQLLTLERLRQVRLVPGRTGRQLVRSVADRGLRGGVEPTLRLFEAVYYGHRSPSAEAFADAWAHAEAFQLRATTGAPS